MARHRAEVRRPRRSRRMLSVVGAGCALSFGAVSALLLVADTASSSEITEESRVGTFVPDSGGYLLSDDGTDGLRSSVAGTVRISQNVNGTGPITAHVNIVGLEPDTQYVAVGYKDAECLPTPGVTAFPSAAFTTNGAGEANTAVTINPKAVLPTGVYTAADTNSISVRAVLASSVTAANAVQTPNVPNVAAPEACDRTLANA